MRKIPVNDKFEHGNISEKYHTVVGEYKKLLFGLCKMREELFWDRSIDQTSAEIILERAINFGGFDFIKEVQEKYGMEKFVNTLKYNRNLGKKVVNYWCLQLSIDRNNTKTFQNERVWEPF